MKLKDWAFMKPFTIAVNGDVYLRRLRMIQTPWFAIYLHRFYRPDADQHLHDHPWNFISWVIRGGYIERHRQDIQDFASNDPHNIWQRWSWHSMGIKEGHKIISVEPGTVTVVFTGRRQREWGFWYDNHEWEHWQEYLRKHTNITHPKDELA